MDGIPVKRAADGLFIACEMERRAIRLYERAAMLPCDTATGALIDTLLQDEMRHLAHFQSLLTADVPDGAEALTLSAYAAEVLFPGGLHGAVREGALDSADALVCYAIEQEQSAVETYRRFADQSGDRPAVATVFLTIAEEEEGHLSALKKVFAP